MKLYIASSWSNKEALKPVQDELERRGHTVTARWIKQHDDIPAGDQAMKRQHAINDINDVEDADALILWANTKSVTGGMFYEAGYANAAGKPIIVVEPTASESIFLQLPEHIHCPSWDDCYTLLSETTLVARPQVRMSPQLVLDFLKGVGTGPR